MKLKSLIVSVLLLLPATLFAQQQNKRSVMSDTAEVFRAVSKKAYTTYRLSDYLSQNLIYPKDALVNEVYGKVVVEFIIEKDGRIADPKILKGKELAHGIREEALRVVSQMPAWEPAERDDQKVRSYYILPIQFSLAPAAEDAMPPRETKTQSIDSFERNPDEKAYAPYHIGKYLAKTLAYPYEAKNEGVEGNVTCSFMVEVDGSITNIKVLRGKDLGYGLAEEAVRVITGMPKWIPAEKDGRPVRSQFALPIVFRLTIVPEYR